MVLVSIISIFSSSKALNPVFCCMSRMASVCLCSSPSRSCSIYRNLLSEARKNEGQMCDVTLYLLKRLQQQLALHLHISELLVNKLHSSSACLSHINSRLNQSSLTPQIIVPEWPLIIFRENHHCLGPGLFVLSQLSLKFRNHPLCFLQTIFQTSVLLLSSQKLFVSSNLLLHCFCKLVLPEK